MKQIVLIYLISLITFASKGQENHLFKSLEEALNVAPDSVYRLDLSKEKLKSFPEQILLFTNLTELYLSKNKLEVLPANFYFPSLKILDLSQNKLKIFPEVICQNKTLTQLFLNKNELEYIPDCIGSLQNLTVLDAWFNTITTIPESFQTLRKLKSVDLQGMNYSEAFQQKWIKAMPWVEFKFNLGCDCGL